MYKRRIVLGGAAPAAVLAFGLFAAAPAMAGTATQGSTHVPATLLSPVQGLSNATNVVSGELQGVNAEVPGVSMLPVVGGGSVPAATAQVAAPAANTASGNGAQSAGQSTSAGAGSLGNATGQQANSPIAGLAGGLAGGQGSMPSGPLGNLGSVSSSLPALNQATGLLNGLGAMNGGLPGLSGVTGLAGSGAGPASALTGALGNGPLSSLGG